MDPTRGVPPSFESPHGSRKPRVIVLVALGAVAAGLGLLTPTAAFAHGGEANVPAFTSIQEAIAVLASHPGAFDIAMDKVHDALDSNDLSGVDIGILRQADKALEAEDIHRAETLLERSIGVCPGQPVVEPADIPRSPQPLDSPCPNVPHLEALDSKPIGGVAEPVLLLLGGIAIVGGLALTRRVHR